MFESLGGLSSLTGGLIDIGLLLFGLVFTIGVIGAVVVFYWFNYKRYKQYECIVYEKDTFGNVHAQRDDAAIFLKGANRRLWLRKNKISMPGDDLPYYMVGKKKTLNVLKKGTKNFVFVEPDIDDEGLTFNVGEEDVNWAAIEWDRSTKNFGQTWIMQMMPYAIVMFSVMIVMVVYIMFIRKLDLLVEISQNIGGALSRGVV